MILTAWVPSTWVDHSRAYDPAKLRMTERTIGLYE